MKNLERSYPGDMQDVLASTLSRWARKHQILLVDFVASRCVTGVQVRDRAGIDWAGWDH